MLIRFDAKKADDSLKADVEGKLSNMRAAFDGAMFESANEIKKQGDEDIRAAGNFGSRWQESLFAKVNLRDDKIIGDIEIGHTIPYARIFEDGGTIKGKPLLWIPLSHTKIKSSAAVYGKRYGLFRVDRAGGAPLLLSMRDRKPKFVGIEAVNIKKRFHLREICEKVFSGFAELYYSKLRKRK